MNEQSSGMEEQRQEGRIPGSSPLLPAWRFSAGVRCAERAEERTPWTPLPQAGAGRMLSWPAGRPRLGYALGRGAPGLR